MALLRRRGLSFTRHPLDGVLSPREFGRVGALLLAGAALVGLLGLGLLVLAGTGAAGSGFHPAVVATLCAATVASCVVIGWRAERFYPSWAAVVMALAITLVTVAAYFSGSVASGYATLFYIWVGTAFVLLPAGLAVLEVALAGVLDAVLLAVQRGHPGPFGAWAFTVGVMALTAWVIKRIVDALMSTAANERTARTEVQSGNDELERISERETEFLTRISHEVRTPLNVIIGFADMLGDGLVGPLNPHQSEYVAEVQGSGRHLLELIGDILDVAKVEEGREDLDLVEFDLDRVLVPAVGLFRPEAERRRIALDLVSESSPILIRGDERKVRQVVLNLLSNAVKFTPSGGSVSVAASVRAGVATVAVSDTGPGIAAGDLDRIFEEYHQARASASSPGTGLGLPLARRFAAQHGGTLDVSSRPDRGSTFTVRVPVAGPPTRRSPAVPPRSALERDTAASWKPLDNPDLRARMAHLPPMLGIGAVLLGGITLVANAISPAPGYRPVPLLLLAAVAVAIAAFAGVRRATLTSPGMSVLLASATVGFTLCNYFVGVGQQPYGTMLYAWIGIAAVSFLARRLAIAHLAFLGATYAALLGLQHGNAAPAARWTVVMGVVVISAMSVDTLLARLGSLADAERRARMRLESIRCELEAASRHKSHFLATMSHELRTPLNAIIGFSEVLQDELFGPLSAKQREYATDLAEAGHQLLSLVNDILDLAKVDAGRMELMLTEDIDITDPLTLACGAQRPVSVDVVIHPLQGIDVDEHKFRRIVDNLIDEVADIAKVERILVTAETSADVLTVDVVADGVIRLDTGVVPLRVAVAAALTELHGGDVETTPGGWRLTLPVRAASRERV